MCTQRFPIVNYTFEKKNNKNNNIIHERLKNENKKLEIF